MQIRNSSRREWRNRTTARRGRKTNTTTRATERVSFFAPSSDPYANSVYEALMRLSASTGMSPEQLLEEAALRNRRMAGRGKLYRMPILGEDYVAPSKEVVYA